MRGEPSGNQGYLCASINGGASRSRKSLTFSSRVDFLRSLRIALLFINSTVHHAEKRREPMYSERVREILSWYAGETPGTLANLAWMLNHGKLAGTGKMVTPHHIAISMGCGRMRRH
jgi:hypothetical protein